MKVYLDTEFTDLDEPNLLSVGMVSASGDEFYCELSLELADTRDRMRVVSDFVLHGPVLSQWGLVPGAACSHLELGRRAGAWLRDLAMAHGGVEVLSDCRLDFELLEGALRHANALQTLRAVITSRTIAGVIESPVGQRAQVAAFQYIARERGLMQHHALADVLALRAAHIGNRATIELSAMRARLGITDESARAAVQQQTADSEDVKDSWVRDGLLIGGAQLSEAWNCSSQRLEQARDRDDLVSLKFRGLHWYPAPMAVVSADDVSQVSAALRGVDAISQFIFWSRNHGSIGGLTVAQAIVDGRLRDVVRLAQSLASEWSER
ncbi:hypothetical protein [Scleromatobacter humisilvae]|uniref:Uncharacterized protein n=1 Tax=Scleromatobacter humisilvae TaxID=2897159 RepID=A0A9X1YMX2_9BURK|nr:hypothetical protein [Scleromatobacter humisilvae]MCK9687322.1 hypothetical protein [Scleromatobacter humisilvae]